MTKFKKWLCVLLSALLGVSLLLSFLPFVGENSRSNSLTASAATSDNTYIDISNTVFVFDKRVNTVTTSVSYNSTNLLVSSGSLYYPYVTAGDTAGNTQKYSSAVSVNLPANSATATFGSSVLNASYSSYTHGTKNSSNPYYTKGCFIVAGPATSVDSRFYSYLNANASPLTVASEELTLSASGSIISAPTGYFRYFWIIDGEIQAPVDSYQLFNASGSVSCILCDKQNQLTLLAPVIVGTLSTPQPRALGSTLYWDSVGPVDYQVQRLSDEIIVTETQFNYYVPETSDAYRVRALGDGETSFDSAWSEYVNVTVSPSSPSNPFGGYNQGYTDGYNAGNEEGYNKGFADGSAASDAFYSALNGSATLYGYDNSTIEYTKLADLSVTYSPTGLVYSGFPASVDKYDLYSIRHEFTSPQTLATLGITSYTFLVNTEYQPLASEPVNGKYTSLPYMYFYTHITNTSDNSFGSPLVSLTSQGGYGNRFVYPFDDYKPLLSSTSSPFNYFRLSTSDYNFLKSVTISRDTLYYKGYTEGIRDGLASADPDGAYTNGFNDGKAAGYTEGLAAGKREEYSPFFDLLSGVVDAPIQALKGLLNFELFGFNLFDILRSLLTIAFIITIVKVVTIWL